jgi:hypothetical protein
MKKKVMNGGFKNDTVFFTEMAIFNLPPELLTFSNWALIQGNLLFFLFFPGSIAIGPLNFSVIYKTSFSF